MKAKTAKRMKRTGITILTLSLVYAGFIIVGNIKLRNAKRAIALDGYPTKLAEVIPPKVADTENAALLYQAAEQILKASAANDTSLYKTISTNSSAFLKEPTHPNYQLEMAKLINLPDTKMALELIEQGTQRSACRYDLDYENPLAMLLSHLQGSLVSARLLSSRALLLAQEGRNEQAWQSMLGALKHANALETEPTLISQLVRIKQFEHCFTAMKQLSPPSAELLPQLDAAIAPFDNINQLAFVINAERLLFGEYFFNCKNINREELANTADSAPIVFYLTSLNPLLPFDHAAYTEVMHAYLQNVQKPETVDFDRLVPRYCIMTRMVFPGVDKVKTVFLKGTAQARITRIALQLQQHQRQSSSYPKCMTEMTGLNTTDPFTEKSLIYKPTETGFILYSVGSNWKDDGGLVAEKKEDGDIVWFKD